MDTQRTCFSFVLGFILRGNVSCGYFMGHFIVFYMLDLSLLGTIVSGVGLSYDRAVKTLAGGVSQWMFHRGRKVSWGK